MPSIVDRTIGWECEKGWRGVCEGGGRRMGWLRGGMSRLLQHIVWGLGVGGDLKKERVTGTFLTLFCQELATMYAFFTANKDLMSIFTENSIRSPV